MRTLYTTWQSHCLILAFFTALVMGSFYLASPQTPLDWVLFVVWLQFPLYLVHEYEEHVWPGGFRPFINHYIFKSQSPDAPLTSAGVFWMNIVIIWGLFPLTGILTQNVALAFGCFMPLFTLVNATTHIIAAMKLGRYNPGLVVSLCLNYPMSGYCLYLLHQMGALPPTLFWSGLGVSVFLHIIMIASVLLSAKRHAPQQH